MRISIKFENCYGVRKLDHIFDFNTKKVYCIHAPNGVMKSSFAKTFYDFSIGEHPKDLIFTDRKTVCEINDEEGKPLNKDSVFVIEPYSIQLKTEKISTILVNKTLKAKYEKIHKSVEEKKAILLKGLKQSSGYSGNLEFEISRSFSRKPLFEVLKSTKEAVLDDTPAEYPNVIYIEVFNDKVLKFLETKTFKAQMKEYVEKYDELVQASRYLKGTFSLNQAEYIRKALKENSFFKATHSVRLSQNNGVDKDEITSDEDLEKLLEEEKQRILSNVELKKRFEEIDKSLDKNDYLREFRDYLRKTPSIAKEISNLDLFRKKLWLSYFKIEKKAFEELLSEYESNIDEIENILTEARNEQEQWAKVIKIFKKRFYVPFEIVIGNQADIILKDDLPSISFTFTDNSTGEKVTRSHDELLQVLSQGEKKALYILNIIFEIESRKINQTKTLFIVDDVADSFDYKNKYAIIEYLKDIAKIDYFQEILLTHNFDFHRTICSRFDMGRSNKLNIIKTKDEVRLIEEKYQKNPFYDWKSRLDSEELALIASIPFVRNLTEFCGLQTEYDELTSLLHIKESSKNMEFKDLERIFRKTLTDKATLSLNNPEKKVMDAIFELADAVEADTNERVELESKVVLAIAIRLKAEMRMIEDINDEEFVREISSNQTAILIEKYKELLPTNHEVIGILEDVNLMTPENIHINSFMYEPILDMSNQHLKQLYGEVKALLAKTPASSPEKAGISQS